MTTRKKHTILLIGDSRMAFPVAKAMSKAGHEVHAGVSLYSNYLEWSRYVSKYYRHEPLEPGTDEAFPTIQKWIEDHPEIDTIQPVGEASARFVAKHDAYLSSKAQIISPGKNIVDLVYNKSRMFEICESIGTPVANFKAIGNMKELEEAIPEIGYPFILKPSKVDAYIFNEKALIIRTNQDLDRLFPEWPEIHPELIIQRYVTGPRHSIIYSAHKGHLLGAIEVCAARTHINNGTGNTTYGITVKPNKKLKSSTEKIVRSLGYSSTGCIQYIVDPITGEITFMELNPRISLARIAEAAGLKHSKLGLSIAHNEPIKIPSDPWDLKLGVQYVWTKGELDLLLKLLKSNDISKSEFCTRLKQSLADLLVSHHAIFDLTDPLPAVGVYANKLIKMIHPKIAH